MKMVEVGRETKNSPKEERGRGREVRLVDGGTEVCSGPDKHCAGHSLGSPALTNVSPSPECDSRKMNIQRIIAHSFREYELLPLMDGQGIGGGLHTISLHTKGCPV